MKTMILKLSLSTVLLTTSLSAMASDQFACTYNNGSVTLNFEGPQGIDLRHPGKDKTILLKVGNSAEPQEFSVSTQVTRAGEIITYVYSHPFFRSVLAIQYDVNHAAGVSKLSGTWANDYPQVTELDCDFLN